MAKIWEEAILILAGNLNLSCRYLITTVHGDYENEIWNMISIMNIKFWIENSVTKHDL